MIVFIDKILLLQQFGPLESFIKKEELLNFYWFLQRLKVTGQP